MMPVSRTTSFSTLAVLVGSSAGLLITFDPYLTNIVSHFLPLYVSGRHFLKYFPYELSVFIFLLSILGYCFLSLTKKIMEKPARASLILISVILHLTAVIKLGDMADGVDLLVMTFPLIIITMSSQTDRFRITALDIVNLFFLFIILLSIPHGNLGSFLKFNGGFKACVLAVIVINVIKTREDLEYFIKWFIIITAAAAVFAIFQEFVYYFFRVLIKGFIKKNELEFMFEETSYGRFFRVCAFTTSYKEFAFYLVTAMLIVFNRLLYMSRSELKRQKTLIFYFIVMACALFLTFSKDSWLAAFITLALSVLISRPYLVFHTVAGICSVILLMFFLELFQDISRGIWSELHTGEFRMRLQLNRDGLMGFLSRHNLTGSGLGKGSRYTGHYFKWPAHNSIILALDEVGILGLLAWFVPIILTIFNCLRLCFVLNHSEDKALHIGLLLAIICMFIMLQFSAVYILPFLWLVMGIVQVSAYLHADRISPIYTVFSQKPFNAMGPKI